MSTQVLERPMIGPVLHAPCGATSSPTGSNLFLKARGPYHGEGKCPATSVLWDAYCGHDHVGYASLDYKAGEFDPILTSFSTAMRLYIYPKFRWRGLGSKLGRAFITQLRCEGFSRPLLASHMAGDEAAARILIQCGFLYTGCKTTGPGGQVCRHMLALL